MISHFLSLKLISEKYMFPISAELLPLKGKYYATKVLLKTQNDKTDIFEINFRDDLSPSPRELEKLGYSYDDYINNIFVRDWFGEDLAKLQDVLNQHFCDSHYETNQTFSIAQYIVNVLNTIANIPKSVCDNNELIRNYQYFVVNLINNQPYESFQSKNTEPTLMDYHIKNHLTYLDPISAKKQKDSFLNILKLLNE